MWADEDGLEHQIARYFMLGGQHIVQCDCGDKFRATTEKKVMSDHFHHSWSKVRSV